MTEHRSIQRFQVVERLGAGGMGTVYRAHDPQLDRDVAIKVLSVVAEAARAELSTLRTLDLREHRAPRTDDLLQEARMMARLSHPNVVPVYEVGLDDGSVFVVMEHVDGADLRAWLTTPRTPAEILAVFAQAARGLAAAHARAIVHRDFKPDNVLVGRDGRARVGDFGLSRLAAPGGMVRVADPGGTPKYMAAELWDGGAATPRSDVFAFCVALVEALDGERDQAERVLRERGVAAPLRELVIAGLADAPAARPEMAKLADALEGVRPRRRSFTLVAGAVAAGSIAAGVIVAVGTAGRGGNECEPDASLIAGRWDADKRAGLQARIAGAPQLISLVDARAAELVAARVDTCTARARGEVSAAQVAQRDSCLERRAIELGVTTQYLIDAKRVDAGMAEERLLSITPATCGELDAPAITGDRAVITALYARLAALDDRPRNEAPEEAAAIEQGAIAAGEAELEVRAAVVLGIKLRAADRLPESVEALKRAYGRAAAIQSSSQMAVALAEHSASQMMLGDFATAKSLAELALQLASKPTTPMRARAKVYRALGRAHLLKGDYRAAVETLRTGLDALHASGERASEIEAMIRLDLTDSVLFIGGREAEALELALANEEFTRTNLGDTALNHAVAVNEVAKAYSFLREPRKALPYRRRSLAIVSSILPADHSQVLNQRSELATTLNDLNETEAARTEYTAVVALAETNPGMRRSLAYLKCRLALTTFDTGRHDEGLRLQEAAVDLMTSDQGIDHPQTLGQRSRLVELQLDIGRLDDAEKTLATLMTHYRTRKDATSRRRAVRLHGEFAAELALARGKPREAEQLARRALAELVELGADFKDRRTSTRNLGASLVELGQFEEARALLEQALAWSHEARMREDFVAVVELPLARAEYGAGKRDEGLARARRIRDMLTSYPGQGRVRREVEAFLRQRGGT